MIGPEVTVPDLTESVIGYRQFSLKRLSQHNYKLCSPHQGEAWDKPEMRARCTREIPVPEGIILPRPPKPHSAPAKDCGCGIYAYFDPCPVQPRRYDHWSIGPNDTYVQALMAMEGRIEVHARGMRSEKARVCALGLNETLTSDERAGLREIARRWGVPLVHQEMLPEMAGEFGRALGDEMRPKPEPDPRQALFEEFERKHMTNAAAPTMHTRRPSRWRWMGPGSNGAACCINLGLFAFGGHSPVSITLAAMSGTVAAWLTRSARAAK